MARAAALLIAAAALAALTSAVAPAEARTRGARRARAGVVLRFPSADLPDTAALRGRLQLSDEPTTIVFERGTYDFSAAQPFFVFGRSNLTLCGATGRARDVVIQDVGTANGVVLLEQTRNITLRNLTIRVNGAADGVAAVNCRSALSTDLQGFVTDTRIEGCVLEGDFGVQATTGTERMTITRTRFVVTREDGFGIRWDDGSGLLVSRCRFSTAPGVAGFSGVFVRGAQGPFARGERASDVILAGNVVTGDFQRGFDLADVVGLRVRRNRILYPDAVRRATPLARDERVGRVGILIRRGDASALPEDYEVVRNRVRRAAYGAWLLNTGRGLVARNDFRLCGMTPAEAATEEFFMGEDEHGAALRIVLQTRCRVRVERNDFRRLRSPRTYSVDGDEKDAPAVMVLPESFGPDCFPDGNLRNRLSRGRLLILIDTPEPEDDPE